jgi:hypothetical protein
MSSGSVTKKLLVFLGLLVAIACFRCRPATAAERPPNLVRSAPVIPWAKSIGEHRYRSPRNYDDTMLYYRKVLRGGWNVSWRKVINVSGVRAQHIRNKNNKRWEGLNIYENKGATFIYVVYTDDELDKIAAAKQKKSKGSKKKPGKTK